MDGDRIQRWQGLRRLTAALTAASSALSVSAAGAAASAGDRRIGPEKSTMHVMVVNEARAPGDALVHATVEASRIWATAGLHLTWTLGDARRDEPDRRLASDGDGGDGKPASIDIYVVVRANLVPVRSQAAEVGRPRRTAVMGRVLFGEFPERAKLIEISLTSTTASVARATRFNRPVTELAGWLRHEVLGCALGRVIAHEIGHLLFGRGHSRDGLMKPVLLPSELTSRTPPALPAEWMAPGPVRRLPRQNP